MSDFIVIEVQKADKSRLTDIEKLFGDMYDDMSAFGLMLPLNKSGASKWIKSISPTLGRMSILLAADVSGKTIGFAHGSLRFLPEYLGNHLTGVVTHIYVDPGFRNGGIAKKLLEALEGWFQSKSVHSIDLQVVSENTPAIKFWEQCGYAEELKQYRKFIK